MRSNQLSYLIYNDLAYNIFYGLTHGLTVKAIPILINKLVNYLIFNSNTHKITQVSKNTLCSLG